jgi:uncharacterized protein
VFRSAFAIHRWYPTISGKHSESASAEHNVYHSSILHIIRNSSFTATPWKNGGGITHEAIRVPAGGDSFRWRVSVAHIEASGAFSDFTGYNRKMVLLRGAGMALRFAGGYETVLAKIGEVAQFDGAAAVDCELLDGACVDLNLMVAKSTAAEVRVERLSEDLPLRGSPAESILIFSIEHALWLTSDAGETQRLDPWDLAVLEQGGRIRPVEAAVAKSPVFIATVSN